MSTPTYKGDTFTIVMHRYSDPHRLNLARNAAIYLGKEDRDNTKRPLDILKRGDVPEIFRGEYAEFEFIDVSKEVYDHIVTYTTRRMRVAGGNRALTSDSYTLPSDRMKNPESVRILIDDSMKNYKELLDEGETPQVARSAMPVAAKMNPFVYSFNFLTLMESLFSQRIWEKGAQGNTVKVVRGMWELCRAQDPELWSTTYEVFGPPTLEWKQVQRKLKKMTLVDLANKLNDLAFDPAASAEEVLRGLFGSQKSMWD